MARIHLIEDDRAVREQLAELLRHAGHKVTCATSFDSPAEDALTAAPDLVIVDLGLPGTDGQYIVRALRQAGSLPILVLTNRTSELDELTSLTLGADDFVPKTANPQLILAHVEALLRRAGGAVQDASTLTWAGVTLDLARSRATHGGSTVELTKNELRILDQLMHAKGAIVSREELMETLWDTFQFVDDNTLTVNVSHLRHKLAGIGASGYVVTHRGQGYSVREPEDADR